MKNRFVRLLRMGLPGLVLAALAGCAAPVGPEETSAPETQVYTVGGVELALPEAEGRFTVVPHPEEGAWRGENLLGVYETESYERGLEEDGRLWGSLFTLVRYEAADYESLLAYGTEPEAFARDADGRYYSFTDTDGSLYRGEDGPTPEEEARWAALQETIPQLRADFITRNGLEPFDEAALLAGPFTYEGEHRYLEYSGTCGTYVLALSQPERQGEGGIWCVERWYRPGGGSGLVFPQQDGQAAAAVYAARQAERDGGDLSYDSPEGAAVHWISEYCGALSVSSGELTEVDGPEGTGREGEPTMAAALAYVFSGRDSAELWGCKDPGSGPWIELLYRQELATLQEWFGACAWERVDAAEEAPWDDSAVPPYGSYTMRLLSDGDIILHWNSPYVAVYLDGEGQIWRCTSGYDQLYRSLAER